MTLWDYTHKDKEIRGRGRTGLEDTPIPSPSVKKKPHASHREGIRHSWEKPLPRGKKGGRKMEILKQIGIMAAGVALGIVAVKVVDYAVAKASEKK